MDLFKFDLSVFTYKLTVTSHWVDHHGWVELWWWLNHDLRSLAIGSASYIGMYEVCVYLQNREGVWFPTYIVLNYLTNTESFLNEPGCISCVPDRRRRIVPEVNLLSRWVTGVLGIWRGEGLGKGLGQERSVYKLPETEVDGSCHS